MATNIPEPTFGPTGFVAPSTQAVLDGAQQDIDAAFGGGLNPALNTPQGQLATTLSASVDNKNSEFIFLSNQFDPAQASGRYQDGLANIYFLTRKPSQPTVVSALCTGGQGVQIPAGSLAQAADGNIYTCTDGGTIGGTGSITLTFACNVLGPVACPADTLTKIYRAIPGWDSINNASDGVLGSDVESQQQFEARRQLSVATNSVTTNEAVMGNVLSVSGVLDAYVDDNSTGGSVTKNGVTYVKNSIYVAAVGGADADVANAIWIKKPPGCDMNGNTTVVVSGNPSLYSQPLPTYNITFERPPALPIFFAVNLANNSQVPADAVAQVQAAIINAFGGGDGGQRARIGGTIYALRYVSPIIQLGIWAQVISLGVGSANNPGAVFTAAIAGTTMTVSAVASGTIAIGQSIADATGNVLPGTVITAGSGSSWTVSISQTVGSESMSSFVPNRQDLQVNANQVPTINANDIAVTLT